MHWLPLVAMVIASALPFPHKPAARIVAASLPPPLHHAPDYSSHQPQDYNTAPADYKSAPVDYNMAEQQNQGDFMTNDDSGVYNLNLVTTLEVPPTESTPVWTPEVTEGQRDAKIYKNNLDSNIKNDMQDSGAAASPESSRNTVDLTLQRTERSLDKNSDMGLLELDGLFEGDMFLDAHPRVLFSTSPPQQPPPLLMLEDEEELAWDEHPDGDRSKREKRSHLTESRWGQRSVCESVNVWVTDKTTAVDTKGNKVTIIQEIQTQSGPIKQYFYETRCRQAEQPQDGRHEETGVDGASCLGIDKKQWKSKCIAKSSFVRALTKDANNRMGWRWIRIDASCVCVLLSRTNNKAPSGRGRG
ncbi:hypothetical protein NQD34_005974 [Periophthalmus magnuspinnatus]|nr:hypothetical protein NQD34_005974 [Periophthalmus magnuspinnatus]